MSLKVNLRHFFITNINKNPLGNGEKTFLTVLLDVMVVNFITKVNL